MQTKSSTFDSSELFRQLKPGQRFSTPLPLGSADALLLAELARTKTSIQAGNTLLILCADAQDVARLQAEINYFHSDLRVLQLPDWETLPYDQFSPHHDLVSERLQTLYTLTQKQCDVLLVSVSTSLYHLSPPSFLLGRTFSFKQNDRLDVHALREQLVNAGYSAVSQVVAPGEFALRGGLIDLFPMGATLPFRVDLFDDTIESIKTFDVDTQRTLYPVPSVQMLPGREYPTDETARGVFRNAWREQFEGDPTKHAIYKDIANGVFKAGIEYYLPLFFEKTATLFDYLQADTTIVLHGEVGQAIQSFWSDTQTRYDFLKSDIVTPVLPPEQLFQREEAWFEAMKPFAQLALRQRTDDDADQEQNQQTKSKRSASNFAEHIHAVPDVRVAITAQDNQPFSRLQAALKNNHQNGICTVILTESLGRQTTLGDTLARQQISTQMLTDWDQISRLNDANDNKDSAHL